MARVAREGVVAMPRACSAPSRAVVPVRTGVRRVWLTPRQSPAGVRCTTRSPPRTRRPWYVRSIRTWVVPSRSTILLVTTKAVPRLLESGARVRGERAEGGRRGTVGGAAGCLCGGGRLETERADGQRRGGGQAQGFAHAWCLSAEGVFP